jgi:UDP-N-acetylmuramoyl-L-alanyl-D-glutamate--2,6-diaminopimelate ligase
VRLHDLLDGVDVLGVRDGAGDHTDSAVNDVNVDSVVSDSRTSRSGALFACIPGRVTDGHLYAPAAVEQGAVALLVERFVDGVEVPQVRVESVRAAVGRVAARAFGDPSQSLRVLGVTGTNGKTTTTYLLDAIARAAGETTGLIGTIETRVADASATPVHTTPEAPELQALLAQMRDAGVTTVSMEVSSHALAQHRVDGTHYAATCFTNLSHDHLDYHGSLDAYFEAKARLFTTAFTDRAAINVDDEHGALLAEWARNAGLNVLTYSARHGDVRAFDVVLARDHTRLVIAWPGGEQTDLTTSLVGPFNVENTIAAAATAHLAGFSFDTIVAGLNDTVNVPGRMEAVDAGQPFTVLVDYAHTPDALERVLHASRSLIGPGGRVLVVYGCGGDRDRAKRPLMGAVAARSADRAFLTSDNPRSEAPEAIAADVLAGVPPANQPRVELDRRIAIQDALAAARPGDVVVIAGKGHEPGQHIGGSTRPFDDRLVARQELEALACS